MTNTTSRIRTKQAEPRAWTPSTAEPEATLSEMRPAAASRTRRFFGVAQRPGTYRRIAYLLLGLPLGVAWFTVIVTAVSMSVSLLVVALVGIPLLWATWHGVRVMANVERGAANALVDQHIPVRPLAGGSGNVWTQLRSMSRDSDRWRELAFAILKFPAGIFTFTLVVCAVSVPLAIAAAPITARLDDHHYATGTFRATMQTFATSAWSPVLVPLGILLLIGALHLLNTVADGFGRLAAKWLGSSSAR